MHHGGHSNGDGQEREQAGSSACYDTETGKRAWIPVSMRIDQQVGKDRKCQDARVGDGRYSEVEQEMAAVHLRGSIEDLTEARRTEICAHTEPLDLRDGLLC
jgi:hypothetical protein